MQGRNKRNRFYGLFLMLFWPLGFLLSWLTAFIPQQVETYYTAGFSKVFAKYVSFITGVFPFSLAEVLVWLLIISLIILFVRTLCRTLRSKLGRKNHTNKKAESILSALCRFLIFLGVIYFSFIVVWGINYNRSSFAEIAGLPVQGASNQELQELCERLIVQANSLRSGLNEDERGVLEIAGKFKAVREKAPSAFAKAAKIYPELGGEFGRPKFVVFSKFMSYAGISGIYFPFTGEANVNIDIPDSMLPATTSHEMAHQRGFAREDEASYIAWVACNSSDDPVFRYSGTLSALIYSINALYAHDPDRTGELQAQYSEGLRRDLRDISEYWEKYEGKLEEVSSDINDAYLKSNRQEEGIQSYGRMVDLLLAEQKADLAKRFLP